LIYNVDIAACIGGDVFLRKAAVFGSFFPSFGGLEMRKWG
jgi:hypothetical protein